MKNILSRAKNYNRRKLGLYSVFCILSVLTVLFVACDKKDEPTPEKTLYGNAPRPTWTAPVNPDPTASMTAIIAVRTLAGVTVPDSCVGANDMLAAFYGETCLGIAKKYEDGVFYMYICGPTTGLSPNDQRPTTNISLRYWSAHYTNLFEADDAFPFVNDTQQGTPDNPFVPAFVVVK